MTLGVEASRTRGRQQAELIGQKKIRGTEQPALFGFYTGGNLVLSFGLTTTVPFRKGSERNAVVLFNLDQRSLYLSYSARQGVCAP
jgi:hypothetical protein